MSGLFGGIAEWITGVVESLGYVGVAVLIALENVFPPIPSELVLPLAGFLAGQGEMAFVGVVAAATAGSVIGALVLYGLGRWLGEKRVRAIVKRYGKFAMIGEDDIDRSEEWFDKHGRKAILIGRLVPFVRSFISVPAGFCGMGLGRFVIYTTIGSAIWNSALVGLGWFLGEQWQAVRQYASYFEYAVLALLVGGVIWFIWKRRSSGNQSVTESAR